MSGEEIVSLYRELASLDAFAKHLSLTRKTAVYKLRTAGVDVIEEIAVAWQNGLALRHLSAQHGPLPQTISQWIKSTGRQIKPRNSNPKYDPRRLQECFELGWTTNRIAKTMGLSWSTVQNARSA